MSNEALGRQYSYNGRIRVLSVQEESAIAEIVQGGRPSGRHADVHTR